MIKKLNSPITYIVTLVLATIIHFLILFFGKYNNGLNYSNENSSNDPLIKKLSPNKIELITHEDLNRLKRAGIFNGKKDTLNPDVLNHKNYQRPGPNIAFKNLGLNSLPAISSVSKPRDLTDSMPEEKQDDIYFKYQKKKIIPPNREHNNIKSEVLKNLGIDRTNSQASNISNFDIRIERPDGVPEDQLNSDEKAFYSFYKRTYMNYVSKLFATYEKVKVTKPGIDYDFENQHLLIAKIDYDENGNIITIKIIKSSESDNVHYFFEEALKNLSIPNPPRIFLKKQKQFSIFYQMHIN